MKSKAADVTFKSNEVILNQALQNCKDWLKVMTGVNVSAEAMKVVAEKALQSRSHSKAFVDIIGMTSKESDLFTAVKTLMDTVSAYSKLAKSSSIAQQVLEYVFTNVETYGGMEKLNQHLEGLVAGKDRLMLEFGVGLPGTVEKTVELTVMKKDKMSPYSVKRAELLTGVIDLMKEYVEDAGRKYKEAVEAILNLNRFVTLVNEYAGLKKPEDRDRVEQQLMQNPLWENFKDLVSFPEPGSSYDYSLDIKDPSVKASVLIRAAKVVKAVFEDASMMLVEVSDILDTLIMGLDEVVEVMSVPEEEYLGIADQGSGNFDYGMALAAMRRKALDMSSNVSTEEILKARQILEQAGIPEEIVFMLEIPEEAQEELKIAAMKTLIAEYIPMFEKAGNPDDIKASLLKDVQSVLKAEAFNKLKVLSAKQIYSEIVLTDRFISANLGTPIKRVASIKPLNIKAEVVSGNKTPVDSFKDEDGDTVYVLDVVFKDGSFMDKVEQVLNAGYSDFLFGELGLSDGITDKDRVEYLWGSDVQDHLKAFDFNEDTGMYVAASKRKVSAVLGDIDAFIAEAETHTNALRDLFETMPDKGLTEEDSQKVLLMNILGKLEQGISGIESFDLNLSKDPIMMSGRQASKKVKSGEYSKEKEKELRDLAKEAREKREAFKGDESSKEYKDLNKDFDEKLHAYMKYSDQGKVEALEKVQAMNPATERPLSQLGLEKFQKGEKWGLRDIESKEVWKEPIYTWVDDVYNASSGMVKVKDKKGDSLAIEILDDSGEYSDDTVTASKSEAPEEMINGYKEALIWTQEEHWKEDSGEAVDDLTIRSFTEESDKRIKTDLNKFYSENRELIEKFIDDTDYRQVGHSLWLTRQGYGTGFADFSGDAADELHKKALALGEVYVELGDDMKIHFMGGK